MDMVKNLINVHNPEAKKKNHVIWEAQIINRKFML